MGHAGKVQAINNGEHIRIDGLEHGCAVIRAIEIVGLSSTPNPRSGGATVFVPLRTGFVYHLVCDSAEHGEHIVTKISQELLASTLAWDAKKENVRASLRQPYAKTPYEKARRSAGIAMSDGVDGIIEQ